MKHEDIDQLLDRAGQSAADDGAAAARVKAALLADLRPARQLASTEIFAAALFVLAAVFAIADAWKLGFHGLHVLDMLRIAIIFPGLLVVSALAASASARTMRPASGPIRSWTTFVLASCGFPVLFSLLFRGYSTVKFVPQGVPCLAAGLAIAIPTGLVAALILRRGFVLDWSRSGLAAGTLSGLAGLAMLEMHCPNLAALHIIVWHVAVVVVSGLLGWGLGVIADRRRI